MRFAELLRLGVAALLVAGCGDGLGPGDVAGTWALARIGADPLPAVVYATDEVTVRLIGDTLVLRPDGSGQRVSVQETQYHLILTPDVVTQFIRTLSFRTVDGRIEITMYCGPAELCTPPPHMVLTPDDGVLRDRPRPGDGAAAEYELVMRALPIS